MERSQPNHASPRPGLSLLAGMGLVAGLVAASIGLGGVGATDASTVTERTRWIALEDGSVLEIQAIIDTAVADPEAAMDTLVPPAQAHGGVSIQAFVVSGKWDRPDIPVPVYYNFNHDGGVSAANATQDAIATWNAVPGQYFRFSWGAATSAGVSTVCTTLGSDEVNAVRMAPLTPGILGSTCSILDGSIEGHSRIVEFDMVINSSVTWSTAARTPANAYDLQTTVLHEFGHALGLGHTFASDAVMARDLGRGQQRRSLRADDVAGLQSLYGDGSQPAETATPTPTRPANLAFPRYAPEVARERTDSESDSAGTPVTTQ